MPFHFFFRFFLIFFFLSLSLLIFRTRGPDSVLVRLFHIDAFNMISMQLTTSLWVIVWFAFTHAQIYIRTHVHTLTLLNKCSSFFFFSFFFRQRHTHATQIAENWKIVKIKYVVVILFLYINLNCYIEKLFLQNSEWLNN